MHFSVPHVILALTAGAMVLPSMARPGGAPQSCNTGSVQCCKQLYKADSSEGQHILGGAGIPVKGVTGLVGTNCTPIGVSAGATTCSTQTVCCAHNNFNGSIVSFDCSPITVNA